MASAPRWRILACVPYPEADGGNVSSAILDLANHETQPFSVQVTALTNPSLEEFKDAVSAHRPNVVYSCGPSSSIGSSQPSLIGPFRFRDTPHASEEQLLAALSEAGVELAYLDAVVSPHLGPALHQRGVQHAVVWPHQAPIPAPIASLFASTFFAFLACCGASPPEAFAAASHGCQAMCARQSNSSSSGGGGGGDGGGGGGGSPTPVPAPPLPAFVSASRPALPDSSSIPTPDLSSLPGMHPSALPSFPGWSDVRLLAPRAELRLLLCGDCSLIDPVRLGALGEALRGLLVLEARGLTLLSSTPLPRGPRNLPPGCQAVRCTYRTTSGAAGCVVLGAPPGVLGQQGLVQHALRMTLVADSVSLQFRLPPPGLSLPAPRSSPSVAGGTLLVDSVAATSVWAVQVLRALCREPRQRGLSSLGVAAVGNVADSSFTAADIARLQHIINGGPKVLLVTNEPAAAATTSEPPGPAGLPTAAGGAQDTAPSPAAPGGGAVDGPDLASVAARGGAYFGNDAHMGYTAAGQLQYLTGVEGGTAGDASPDGASEGAYDGFADGSAGDGASLEGAHLSMGGRMSVPPCDKRPSFTGDLPGYTCRRPPLSVCTESQFYDDLVEFLTLLRGKPIDRARFPEAVLNGVALDLWALYREVVTRGGFRVGNGINWKGQVFPRMRNWTETNKQTGVGNALKRHYQNYLWEYEMAHPDDVTLDRCVLCNGGDGVASDWVCCDACENWAHFSCDKRPGLGAFKDYAQGQGRVYTCPSCAREQEAEEAVKRQRTA